MSLDPQSLEYQLDVLENIEKASLRMVFQAICDFIPEAKEFFVRAKDLAGTVGEDVTREAMDSMGLSRVPGTRLVGKIDYKRATYHFNAEYSVRQALFVDSKAEKGEESSATIQTSQTSLRIRMRRAGEVVEKVGKLEPVFLIGSTKYLVTTVFVKYIYHVTADGENQLVKIILAGLPNGMLQGRYNPSPDDTIWRVGRHSPKRGEEFRVRISFPKLKAKRNWRVQTISVYPNVILTWDE